MTMKICIGIVLYETSALQLEKLAGSIAWQDCDGAEILIFLMANDGQIYSDATSAMRRLFADAKNVRLQDVVSGPNIGFGAAHNALCRLAKEEDCEIYIGANPDGMFHYAAISCLLENIKTHSSQTLFEFMQFPQEHPKIYDCFTHETNWASGACFAIRSDFFLGLGGFDESMFMYCEDVDLSWRVRAAGGKCIMLVGALFFHDLSADRSRFDTKIRMLCSGRYLGWKWRNEAFMKVMETQMMSLGFSPDMQTLPSSDLNRMPCDADVAYRICDFDSHFLFSRARW